MDWRSPELTDYPLQVDVTFLTEKASLDAKARGRRMAEILEKIAATRTISAIDPVLWQRKTRQDRSLPAR